MIVRVLTEGQFDIVEADVDALNALDATLTAALDAVPSTDAADWHDALRDLVAYVRAHGTRLADDDLRPSDAVVPDEEATIEDVRALLTDDGLIPG